MNKYFNKKYQLIFYFSVFFFTFLTFLLWIIGFAFTASQACGCAMNLALIYFMLANLVSPLIVVLIQKVKYLVLLIIFHITITIIMIICFSLTQTVACFQIWCASYLNMDKTSYFSDFMETKDSDCSHHFDDSFKSFIYKNDKDAYDEYSIDISYTQYSFYKRGFIFFLINQIFILIQLVYLLFLRNPIWRVKYFKHEIEESEKGYVYHFKCFNTNNDKEVVVQTKEYHVQYQVDYQVQYQTQYNVQVDQEVVYEDQNNMKKQLLNNN